MPPSALSTTPSQGGTEENAEDARHRMDVEEGFAVDCQDVERLLSARPFAELAAQEHADGTRTHRWRVRLVDFDQPKGTILKQVDRLDYRIVFED